MSKRQIGVDTLRKWLDEGRPVTILDVRTDRDRADWSIPGSVSVNPHALRTGSSGPLATLSPPPGQPVVVVCAAGRTSRTAAALLAARGIDAHSLAGGMKAWSLAWNTAEVPLGGSALRIVQLRRTGKGCLSYLVGSDGDAVAIDPSLPVDVYLEEAARLGWRIRTVLETHIHADHLTRGPALARRAGAALLMPDQRRAHFRFTPVSDGDRIEVGRASLAAMLTPGHTEESTCYVLDGRVIFTGDTLFTDGVGRPDLHGGADDVGRSRAAALYHSLRKVAALDDELIVLASHVGSPVAFDRRPVAASLGTIRTWLDGWLVSEAAFVERLTAHLPPAPANFVEIVRLNEAGELPAGDPTDLEAGANRCAVA
jgi:glyoxylase-like metal-dependent hydrolase (beta-lactamase superfamily II)